MANSELSKIVIDAMPGWQVERIDEARDFSVGHISRCEKATLSHDCGELSLGPLHILGIKSSSLATLKDVISDIYGIESSFGGALNTDGISTEKVILTFPHLTNSKQDFLRSHRVAFVDTSGNAWILFPGIYVDRRGFAKSRNAERTSLDGASKEIRFSDSMSLVIRILLDAKEAGIREISSIARDRGAQLSPGQTSKMVSQLRDTGYIEAIDSKVRIRRTAELIREWSDAYRRVHNRDTLGLYLPEKSTTKLRDACGRAIGQLGAITGKAGASLVDGYATFDTVTILTRDVAKATKALEEIGATQVESGANVLLVYPRYRDSAFWDEREIGGNNVVSDLQLYLDLLRDPRRGEEAAEHLYESKLKAELLG